MAILFIDGFDHYGSNTELPRGGWSGTGGVLTTGRFTGKAIDISSDFTSQYAPFSPQGDFVVVGFAYKPVDALPSPSVNILGLVQAAITQIAMYVTAGGEIQIKRSTSTTLGTSTGAGISVGVWKYIELKVVISNTVGTVDVQVDGSNVLSLTSQDTQQSAIAEVDAIEFKGSTAADHLFDDVYFLDDSGTDATDFLGDCQVETLFPDGDGATNNFTAVGAGTTNADRVDDGATPDNDTTYVHSSTATHQDLYTFGNITGNVDTVYAVGVKLLARKEDAGYRGIRTVARNNVTQVESGTKGVSIDYTYVGHIYENDPDGGANWTEADVNSSQFGIDLHA